MKYRVGRKQNRAILDEDGHEVALCAKGQEALASKICDLLNSKEAQCSHVFVSNLDPDEEDFDLICNKCGKKIN